MIRKVTTGFPKRSCSTKNPERDVDSTQNRRALVPEIAGQEISLLRRIAGRSRANSRPRWGKRRGLTSAVFSAASISNACLKRQAPAGAKLRRICLDPRCHNAYKKHIKQEGRSRKLRQERRRSCGSSGLLFS